jgi:hypothetical protein
MVRTASLQALGLSSVLCLVGVGHAHAAMAPVAVSQPQQAGTQQSASPSIQQAPSQTPTLPPALFPAPVPPQETQPSTPAAAPTPSNQPAAQTIEAKPEAKPASDDSRVNTVSPLLLKHLAEDQVSIWTSPARIRTDQTVWLVPLAGVTAGFFVTDYDASAHLSSSPSTISRWKDISNYGAYSMVGGAAGLYFLGNITHNDHERETGFLSGEAALDSLAVTETLKYATGRQRPYQDNGNGNFWQGGTSFPSEHAAVAWSIAGIVAHE